MEIQPILSSHASASPAGKVLQVLVGHRQEIHGHLWDIRRHPQEVHGIRRKIRGSTPVAGYYDEELRLEASCSINKHCLTCTSFPSARFVNKWFLSEGKQDICVRGNKEHFSRTTALTFSVAKRPCGFGRMYGCIAAGAAWSMISLFSQNVENAGM